MIVPGDNHPTFQHMMILSRVYQIPLRLLYDQNLTLSRRLYLLERWHDDRARFLYENFYDSDYLKDRDIDQLLRCLHKIKVRRDLH